MKKRYKFGLAVIIILTVVLSFYFRAFDVNYYITYFQGLNFWFQFLIIFSLLFIQTFIINIPTTTVATIIVPRLYSNLYQAIFVNVASQIIVAILVFFLFRYLIGDMIDVSKFKRMKDLNDKYGKWTVFIARVIPVFGFDAVNIGAAVLGIKKRDYVIGTIFSLLLVLPIWTYLGWSFWN